MMITRTTPRQAQGMNPNVPVDPPGKIDPVTQEGSRPLRRSLILASRSVTWASKPWLVGW